MKIYLVGGAVRDQLLGYPVKEKDWVVVGGTPGQLLKQGYVQVGKDFPVFLHPETKEEYALARTERKSGKGYLGFDCDFSDTVSLEEDLQRRDLTINAMAIDDKGKLIDPYQGYKDLKAKKLRHVSPAFIEDPVRVLRIARFAARYHHLGFTLAKETRLLMYKMVKNGELNYLVPERVWQEWQRSLEECNPEIFITTLRSCGALAVILPEINALFGVPNPKQHHPEIDSGIHSLFVLQAATDLSKDPIVRFAALLHDLGKALTPMAEWPKHLRHEDKGQDQIIALCERLRVPSEYKQLALLASKFHLKIHKFFELRPNTILKILEQTDAFRRPALFEKLLLVCEADAQGRGKKIQYSQADKWRKILALCSKISPKIFIEKGLTGIAIKEALHQERVRYIQDCFNSGEFDEK
jgi:tRNA nucleotidyltransferase (CCA-adding enzyme)